MCKLISGGGRSLSAVTRRFRQEEQPGTKPSLRMFYLEDRVVPRGHGASRRPKLSHGLQSVRWGYRDHFCQTMFAYLSLLAVTGTSLRFGVTAELMRSEIQNRVSPVWKRYSELKCCGVDGRHRPQCFETSTDWLHPKQRLTVQAKKKQTTKVSSAGMKNEQPATALPQAHSADGFPSFTNLTRD